jgi:hypothetical protein
MNDIKDFVYDTIISLESTLYKAYNTSLSKYHDKIIKAAIANYLNKVYMVYDDMYVLKSVPLTEYPELHKIFRLSGGNIAGGESKHNIVCLLEIIMKLLTNIYEVIAMEGREDVVDTYELYILSYEISVRRILSTMDELIVNLLTSEHQCPKPQPKSIGNLLLFSISNKK